MKMIKSLLLTTAALATLILFAPQEVMAQETTTETEEVEQAGPPRGQGRRGDLREKRREMMEAMNLSDEQKTQFNEIQKKYREEMRSLRDNSSGDRAAMMEGIKDILDRQREELAGILSEDQMAVFSEYEQKLRARRKGSKSGGK